VELRLDCSDDLPYLRGDRHEFQQVLINLFINSLDAFENHPGECWISLQARHENGFIRIEVEDNGPGMDKEDLQYVVNPFFSDKRRPDASGLGMFISYSIIENHGGEMELESEAGKGFRVRISMPSAERAG
jgi:signal transduction histidine kinase